MRKNDPGIAATPTIQVIERMFALIDVLKRQKMHLVASTVFKYCEDDFNRVLEMGKRT